MCITKLDIWMVVALCIIIVAARMSVPEVPLEASFEGKNPSLTGALREVCEVDDESS